MLQHSRWPRAAVLVGLFVCALAGPASRAAQPVPVVAAAADLQFALEEVAQEFEKDTGRSVRLAFGSSGNFVRQLEQGAPFEVFLSADEQFVFRLAERGLTRDRGSLYAVGRIVLFAPARSALDALSAQGLRDALAAGRVKRFAIANPQHAPYGRAAEQWLQRHGLWSALAPILVFGENASQAAQFASSGNADGGIIPYSLALAPQIGGRGTFVVLPADEHEPLNQRMVLMKNASADAESFYSYMQEPTARRILRRYGFRVPGESAERQARVERSD